MNKTEDILDKTALPYGSIAISAKENIGIEQLKLEILRKFRDELLFCELFVPYAKMPEFTAIKGFSRIGMFGCGICIFISCYLVLWELYF